MPSTLKRICLLGSTGSIGRKTLQVVRDHPDRFKIVGLSAYRSSDELETQVREFQPDAACLVEDKSKPAPGEANGSNGDGGATRRFRGAAGLLDLIEDCSPDLIVIAIVGAAALLPTLRAIESGATVALANKEVLVTAGSLIMAKARKRNAKILPIDSEHNAIFQCLDGRSDIALRRVILTGSGGPFRGWSRSEMQRATLQDALKHPTWSMGRKITIDSATLMNKGFEVIEGLHLFGLAVDRFEVVIHPQSIVHSMVEFVDGSIIAQLGVTDMYFPIAHVLSYPERLENSRFDPLDLTAVGNLSFEPYDPEAFPCLGYGYEAARKGGTYPAALNAANEVAVQKFLDGELRFVEVPEVIDSVLQSHESVPDPDLEEIQAADAWARQKASSLTFSRT